MTRTARNSGSNQERQSVGLPGHCEECVTYGHMVAHPRLGCADVGCDCEHEATSRARQYLIWDVVTGHWRVTSLAGVREMFERVGVDHPERIYALGLGPSDLQHEVTAKAGQGVPDGHGWSCRTYALVGSFGDVYGEFTVTS